MALSCCYYHNSHLDTAWLPCHPLSPSSLHRKDLKNKKSWVCAPQDLCGGIHASLEDVRSPSESRELLTYTTLSCTSKLAGTTQAPPPQLPLRAPTLSILSCCSSMDTIKYSHPPHTLWPWVGARLSPPTPCYKQVGKSGHFPPASQVSILQTAVLVSALNSTPYSAWHTAGAQ